MKHAHLLDENNRVTQISVLDDNDTAQDCINAYGVQTIVRDTPAGIGYTYDAQTKRFIAPLVIVPTPIVTGPTL